MSLFRRSFALFLVLTALVASTWCISDNQTVVIIGGGVAGLSAAYRLRSMGVKNVIIIEAIDIIIIVIVIIEVILLIIVVF